MGPYVVDFVCYTERLIVEVDGGQHALTGDRDHARTLWLESKGFQLLRFWNHDVLGNTDGVIETIRRAFRQS